MRSWAAWTRSYAMPTGLYPAKDGRMPADMFRRAYPRWEEFAAQKDPRMSSDFWRRVAQ